MIKDEIREIKFNNQQAPSSPFDLILLEKLLRRKGMDHNPCEPHRVDFFMIIYISRGQGNHRIDFQDYSYESGTILTVRKDQIHQFVQSPARGFLLLFTGDFMLSYLEKMEAIRTLQLFNEWLQSPKIQLGPEIRPEVEILIGQIYQEYFEKRDGYSMGIIRSLLHVLIGQLYRAKTQQGLRPEDRKYLSEFIQFQQWVEEDCFHTKKVKDYADRLACTPKTLNKIVRRIVHKSAKAFIDEVLITQIKRLLIHSDASVKEIAYQAGFEEPSNIYKYFKKFTGMSPEGFRQAYLK